jgi:hypothetical protein
MITNEAGTSVEIYDKSADLSVTITDPADISEWNRLVFYVRGLPISTWKHESEVVFSEFFNKHFFGRSK